MTAIRRFTAEAYKEGKWWMISIPEINGLTQAKSVATVPDMATDLVAISLDIPADQIDVSVTYRLEGEAAQARDKWINAQKKLTEAKTAVEGQLETLAKTLKDQGHTVRDIGALTGYSFQRISQILNQDKA